MRLENVYKSGQTFERLFSKIFQIIGFHFIKLVNSDKIKYVFSLPRVESKPVENQGPIRKVVSMKALFAPESYEVNYVSTRS